MKEYNATLIDYGEGKGKLVVESQFGKVTFAVKADSHMFVELERPHGEWIDVYYGVSYASATCSVCNKSEDADVKDSGFGFEYSFPPFCPNCGASMKKAGDEE